MMAIISDRFLMLSMTRAVHMLDAMKNQGCVDKRN